MHTVVEEADRPQDAAAGTVVVSANTQASPEQAVNAGSR